MFACSVPVRWMDGQARDPGWGHRSFTSWCPQARGTNPSSHGSTRNRHKLGCFLPSQKCQPSPRPWPLGTEPKRGWVQAERRRRAWKWAAAPVPLPGKAARTHPAEITAEPRAHRHRSPWSLQTTPGGFCCPHGDAAAPTSIRTPPQKGGLAGPAAGLQEVPGAYIRWLRAMHPSTTGRGPNPCVPPSVTALLALPEAASSGSTFPILFSTRQSLGGEAPLLLEHI